MLLIDIHDFSLIIENISIENETKKFGAKIVSYSCVLAKFPVPISSQAVSSFGIKYEITSLDRIVEARNLE